MLSIGGVTATNPKQLMVSLLESFPDLERVVIAYDMDQKTNDAVQGALFRLLEATKDYFIKVDVAIWDIEMGKGIDDILLYGRNNDFDAPSLIEYIPAKKFQEMLDEESPEYGEPEINENSEATEADIESESSSQDSSSAEAEESKESQKETDSIEDKVEYEEPIYTESEIDTFGIAWKDFSRIKFPEMERVISGLYRGNVGELVAATNVGKSTLILNMALSAAANKHFEPFVSSETVGRRMLYIDGEATKAELQADIYKMVKDFSAEEKQAVGENLILMCDEEFNYEPLDLVNPAHYKAILEKARNLKPDLIIIDTLSALALMEDENDNAKVRKEILAPLKRLANETKSAVLMLHHTGKYNEGSQNVDSYKGRGASAFGALSRAVFNLKVEGKNLVKLSCSKIKGDDIEPLILKLDKDTRWFSKAEGKAAKEAKETNYDKVVEFVLLKQREVQRKEIVEAFNGEGENPKIGESTITSYLARAVEEGLLEKPRTGFYSAPRNVEQELPLEV